MTFFLLYLFVNWQVVTINILRYRPD